MDMTPTNLTRAHETPANDLATVAIRLDGSLGAVLIGLIVAAM